MFNLHTMQIQCITGRCGLKERALILDVIYIMLGEPQLFGNVISTLSQQQNMEPRQSQGINSCVGDINTASRPIFHI